MTYAVTQQTRWRDPSCDAEYPEITETVQLSVSRHKKIGIPYHMNEFRLPAKLRSVNVIIAIVGLLAQNNIGESGGKARRRIEHFPIEPIFSPNSVPEGCRVEPGFGLDVLTNYRIRSRLEPFWTQSTQKWSLSFLFH